LFVFAFLDVFSGDSVEHSAAFGGKDTGVQLEVVSLLVFLDKFEFF
jgi:hypothetical protein